MNLFETIQDIEELRELARKQNETIRDLQEKLDFETNVNRDLKAEIATYDYRLGNAEARHLFYEDIIRELKLKKVTPFKIVDKFKVDGATYVVFRLSDGSLIISPWFISDYIDNVFEKIAEVKNEHISK